MSSSTGKSTNDLDQIAALINRLSGAHQAYVSARTTIRDFVISLDANFYTQVEQYLATAKEELDQAKLVVGNSNALETIQQLATSIHDWGVIAGQVHDAFSSYHETVKGQILANFSALSDGGKALVRLNALLTTGIVLDVQTAHTAVTSYLSNGDDDLLKKVDSLISMAKTRINQADRSDEHLRVALQSFGTTFDTYADGLRKAVVLRKKAYQLFHSELAPLGAKTQANIEQFRQQSVEDQRRLAQMQ